jgi:LysR family transcriptional regulator, glycine cleavage system transcriptional activator
VLPSFAANWLVPRLDEFHALNPNILIDLDARMEVSPIGPGGLDVAIRYGSGPWPGLVSERLMGESLFPACSPAYRSAQSIEGVQDFARARLLRNSWQSWTAWFQAAGMIIPEPVSGMIYNDAGLIIDAAIAGHGVALVRKVIAHDAIADGRLVRLSAVEIPYAGAYHYVVNAQKISPAGEAFRKWINNRLRLDFDDRTNFAAGDIDPVD